MTVRTNSVQTCDRCEKPFNEKHLKAADVVPTFKQHGLVVTETKGTNKDPEPKFTVVISFDDMCPDCQKAIDNLIAKMRLDGKKKRGPAKKRGEKKPEEKKPPKTPEYSENPEDDPAKAEGETVKETAEKVEKAAEKATETGEPQVTAVQGEEEPENPEEPPADAPAENSEPEEPELANEPGETSDGDNGAEATSETDDGLVEDPLTGDRYDPETGEVKVRGNKGQNGEKHPF